MPTTLFYEVRRADTPAVQGYCRHYANRLLSIMEDCPIPFRTQNGGDYDGHQTLKPGLEGSSAGLTMHQQYAYRYFFSAPKKEDQKTLDQIAEVFGKPDFKVRVGGTHRLEDFRAAIEEALNRPERGKRFFSMLNGEEQHQ